MGKTKIQKHKILIFIIYLVFLCSFTINAKDCKIKMARSSGSFAKTGEKLIYNEGVMEDNQYKENSMNPYTTSGEDSIEYFYIFEAKAANHNNHDKVKTLITSHDTSILDVRSQTSNSNSEYHDGFDMNQIEVIFSCITGKSGKVKISMIITSDQCDPFTLEWQKECTLATGGVPSINIGFTETSSEVVKDGKYILSTGQDTTNKFTIDKDTPMITLYITSSGDSVHKMKQPEAIFNEGNILTLFKGELQVGGIIEKKTQVLHLAIGCKDVKVSTTDIQLKISFDNDQHFRMFFSKECDTTESIQNYFTIIKIVYWILIILIVLFIVVITLYYLRKNELTVFEALDRMKEYIDERLFRKDQRPSENELTVKQERLYDDDSLDIKITTTGGETELKNSKGVNMDYGGI